MPNPIVRGFSSIARFSGRDTRAQFWPYAGAAVALYLVVGWVGLIPLGFLALGASPPAAMTSLEMVVPFLVWVLLVFVGLVAILAAAVARRLHDSGRSAILGLMPLPFAAYSGAMFFRLASQFGTGAPDMGTFLSVFVSNLLYMVCVVTLVVLLVRPSTPGTNRYGERG